MLEAQATFQAAVIAHRAGDLASAERGYRRVLRDHPTLLVGLKNLSLLLADQDRLEDLADVHRQILALEPNDTDRAYRVGVINLTLGRYAEGWPLYELRQKKRDGAPKTTVPEWQGEPLAGKSVVVWHEQGLGDQIMASRFVPLLGAARVQYACLDPLARLLGQVCPTLPRLGEVRGSFDYWVSSMSLPHRLGVTLETLPPPFPFTATPRRTGRIGVCTAASEQLNPGRSLPPEIARELLALPGAISLHPEDTGAADFQDTADIIAGLEVVVTVDTAVAHLSGALGKPTLLMLPAKCDWKWMRGRSDSPWYPSATLFRQPRPGDWASVLEAVKAAL